MLAMACASAAAEPPARVACEAFHYEYANHKKAAEGCRRGGQRDGKFRVWRPSGKLWAEGRYVDGVRQGEWVTTQRDGSVTRETWDKGHLEGARALDPDPAVALASPERIDRDGSVILSRSREWKGRTCGEGLQWHSNGKLMSDMFLWNDLKTDFAFVFDDAGRLEHVYEYDSDGNLNDEARAP